MADERSVPVEVPKLGGRKWEDVAPYLEEFLRRLTGSADQASASLTKVEQTIELQTGDEPFSPRPPLPHVHSATELQGLEPATARRPPAPHTHQPADIPGVAADTQVVLAQQVFGG